VATESGGAYMLFNCEELSILETLVLNKIVNIRCKKLELLMDKEFIDDNEYVKEERCFDNQLNELAILHNKILKYLEG